MISRMEGSEEVESKDRKEKSKKKKAKEINRER
jgi:hypothetical protein